jgi:hypothetical protein
MGSGPAQVVPLQTTIQHGGVNDFAVIAGSSDTNAGTTIITGDG